MDLSAFGSMNIGFPSEKSIFLDFFSARGVATLDCEFDCQAGLAKADLKWLHVVHTNTIIQTLTGRRSD